MLTTIGSIKNQLDSKQWVFMTVVFQECDQLTYFPAQKEKLRKKLSSIRTVCWCFKSLDARPSVKASRRSTTRLHFQLWSRVCSFI